MFFCCATLTPQTIIQHVRVVMPDNAHAHMSTRVWIKANIIFFLPFRLREGGGARGGGDRGFGVVRQQPR
jgi:hypothetical protein